ncbi:hypothetical protein AB0D14_35535 [Streptomyces sp. NPDC048484]|uniref:hypothetical protein n=1 Tax=Streptomyces sp. NPDC048484 TaxID=3155146 RepID=UPI00341E6905
MKLRAGRSGVADVVPSAIVVARQGRSWHDTIHSYTYDLAAGGSVVVVLTGLFVLTWCLAPRHGLLAKLVRRPDATPLVVAGR